MPPYLPDRPPFPSGTFRPATSARTMSWRITLDYRTVVQGVNRSHHLYLQAGLRREVVFSQEGWRGGVDAPKQKTIFSRVAHTLSALWSVRRYRPWMAGGKPHPSACPEGRCPFPGFRSGTGAAQGVCCPGRVGQAAGFRAPFAGPGRSQVTRFAFGVHNHQPVGNPETVDTLER